MRANKLVSKQGRRGNRAQTTGVVRSDRLPVAVRHERRELMRADAILRCVAVALEYDGWTCDQPDYAEAIGVARHLISQSIERLESHSDSSTVDCVASELESSK